MRNKWKRKGYNLQRIWCDFRFFSSYDFILFLRREIVILYFLIVFVIFPATGRFSHRTVFKHILFAARRELALLFILFTLPLRSRLPPSISGRRYFISSILLILYVNLFYPIFTVIKPDFRISFLLPLTCSSGNILWEKKKIVREKKEERQMDKIMRE